MAQVPDWGRIPEVPAAVRGDSSLSRTYGGKGLSGIALPGGLGSARPRPIYSHTVDETGRLRTSEYSEGFDVLPGVITKLSYNKTPKFEIMYNAQEIYFDSGGTKHLGGTESFGLPDRLRYTKCLLCFADVDLLDGTLMCRPDPRDHLSIPAYIMATSDGRTLCNDCIPSLSEGQPFNLLESLYSRGRVVATHNEEGEQMHVSLLAHSLDRISRLNANDMLTESALTKCTWYILERNGQPIPPESHDADDKALLPPRSVTVIAQADWSWWEEGGSLKPRKLNVVPYIMAAASLSHDGLSLITLFPTVFSRDVRVLPQHHQITVRSLVDYTPLTLTAIEVKRMIEENLFLIVRDAAIPDDSPFAKTLASYVSHEELYGQFEMLSSYKFFECYSCHRCYRGSVGRPCSGSICPYVGRVPAHGGLTMNSAMLSYLFGEGAKPFKVVDVGLGPYNYTSWRDALGHNHDVFNIRIATRCELSGSPFICTDGGGGLARPKFYVKVRGMTAPRPMGFACCVACWSKFSYYGVLEGEQELIPEDHFVKRPVTITYADLAEYESSMDSLFCGTEVPMGFEKTAALALSTRFVGKPDLDGNYADRVTIKEMRTILASCVGEESLLISPFATNFSAVTRIDAWDWAGGRPFLTVEAEQHLSDMAPVQTRSQLRWGGTGSIDSESVADLCVSMGPSSLVVSGGGGKPEVTPNTRFVISPPNIYRATSNDVTEAASIWLSSLPDTYTVSAYLTLCKYRAAVVRAIQGVSRRPSKSGLGFKEVSQEDLLGVLCQTIIRWGVQRTNKLKASVLVASGFASAAYHPGLSKAFDMQDDPMAARAFCMEVVAEVTKKVREGEDKGRLLLIPEEESVIELSTLVNSESIMQHLQSITGVRKRKDAPHTVTGSGPVLTLVLSPTSGRGVRPTLTTLRECGELSVFQRDSRDVLIDNFIGLSHLDEAISKPGGVTVLLSTPPFIWRALSMMPESGIPNAGAGMNYRSAAKIRLEAQGKYSKCVLTWEDGLAITFPYGNPTLKLKWGMNLNESSLRRASYETTLQQGPNSMALTFIRKTMAYFLSVSRAEYFGVE